MLWSLFLIKLKAYSFIKRDSNIGFWLAFIWTHCKYSLQLVLSKYLQRVLIKIKFQVNVVQGIVVKLSVKDRCQTSLIILS